MWMRRVLQLTPVVALIGATVNSAPNVRKCGSVPPHGKAYFAIDGVIQPINEPAPMQKLTSADIFSVEILCMNPEDSTFNRRHGHQVVSIWTLSGPAPRAAEAARLVQMAQDAVWKKHNAYIATVSEIELPPSMERVRLTLKADTKGWIAHTTIDRLLRTCTVFDGEVPGAPAAARRNVSCVSD